MVNLVVGISMAPPLIDTFIVPEVPSVLYALFDYGLTVNLKKNCIISLEDKKVGLALSGGGYRAAFFHLGVLANLAEKDILKHVDVLSTVSGGSIIGALYIQKLRARLLKKEYLIHSDYIEIVQELENDFISGVSKNVRSKVFLHPFNELKSVFKAREKILAQLYEKYFYSSNLKMDELQCNNLPKFIINSTYLGNGGHWYFSQDNTGQYSDSKIIDTVGEISYKEKKILVSEAVAASSAVPGLFNYIKIKTSNGSYKLVDGGAFDNLGIFALQKEKCDFIIISDGSKQFTKEQLIPRKRLSVLKRSYDASLELNKKLMLEKCSNYLHIHLKENHKDIDSKVSEALSKIRTDLNNFSEQERKSLSYFAYLLTNDIEKYVTTIPSITDFKFKDDNNIKLLKTPDGNFLNNLKKGSKLNQKGKNQFSQALNEMKFFIISFLLMFLVIFYVGIFGSIGIISLDDPTTFEAITVFLVLIEIVTIYLMLSSSIGDSIHYIDFGLAKMGHFLLSIFYIISLLGTILMILLIVFTTLVKIF